MRIPKQIQQCVDDGFIFFVNHSGGKDSQAMTILLNEIIPRRQLIIIHSHLPEVEWEGTIPHIEKNSFGLPLFVGQSIKTFFEMVERRGKFPDAHRRQCTSDLKRDVLSKIIRQYLNGLDLNPKKVVSCMGMRAEESTNRSKLKTVKKNKRESVAGRTWIDWLPIHKIKEKKIFDIIREANQKPFYTYGLGMSRKSCSFCIMGCKKDLQIAAKLRPDLYRRYVELEKKLGHTLQMSGKSLEEITGIKI